MGATLFDFDGVLVDSEPVHLAAFNDILGPVGISIGEAEYKERLLSLDDAGVFRTVLSAAGLSSDEGMVAALVAAKAPQFMARFEGAFRVFPGAAELVARRAAQGPVGIVSGALEREIDFALSRMGVRAVVSFVVSAESTAASKPDPAPFLAAVLELKRLGHLGDAVAVEDSVGGIISAKRAGLRCVAVAHSYTPPELLAAGADDVARDLASLTDAVLDRASAGSG